jgi:DNA polymerase-3 subunit delta
MVYFLFGPDTYRSQHKLQEIKQKYIDASQGDMNLVTLEGAAVTAQQLEQQLQAMPFLANRRLVVIKNLILEGKKDVAEAALKQLESLPDTTIALFYEAGQPDRRGKLFSALNQPKQTQEFPLLGGPDLERFAQGLAEKRGYKFATLILRGLLHRIGGDLWRLEHEIDKLSLYSQGTGEPITEKVIDQLVIDNSEVKIFDITDAFGLRQGERAVALLKRMDPEEAHGLLAMIAGQYRNIFMVADAQQHNMPKSVMSKELGMHSFVVDKTAIQVAKYSIPELKRCYRYLMELDLATKQSLLEPMTGLLSLAAALDMKPIQLPSFAIALTEENVLQ